MTTSTRLVFLVSLVVVIASAQSFTGGILGTVKDSSGSVIPNVSVSIVNAGTNSRTEVMSDAQGNCIGPLLPPGAYNIEASAPGFKKFVREGIVLQVQQQARVEIIRSRMPAAMR